MRTRGHGLTITSCVAIVMVMTACSTDADVPAEGSTVQLQADYPPYDEESLVDEATLIVEGAPVSTEPTVISRGMPEGDDPEENPYLGATEEEKQRAVEEFKDIAATAVTFRIDVVHRGEVEPGDEATVVQTGGSLNGVTYELAAEPPLAVGEEYLLFVNGDDPYGILGGSAGAYRASDDGTYTAVTDMGPFDHLTTSEAAALTE